VEESAAQSMADVEKFLGEVEALARKYRPEMKDAAKAKTPASWIDVVSISLYGGDHCNEHTLKQLPSSVPVIAYDTMAYNQIIGWKHFDTVLRTPKFNGDWQENKVSFLPDDISISMLQDKTNYSNLHWGQVVAFKTPQIDVPTSDQIECVYYTAHGTPAKDITPLANANPPINVLALLHGRLRVDVGFVRPFYFTANMGSHNGLAVSRKIKSKYWIPTHDEEKVEQGFTKYMLMCHDRIPIEDAAAACAKETGENQADILKAANFHEVGNGRSMVLV
jgi:hypothetical protein